MFTIAKSFTFDAAHHIDGLPEGHKCGRVHGHTYTVEVVINANHLDATGFVVDFGNLDPLREFLTDQFDHQDLNDRLPDDLPPTSEHLARLVFRWCFEHLTLPARAWVDAVRVSETPSTWAEYRP